jgi:hypothetical protein
MLNKIKQVLIGLIAFSFLGSNIALAAVPVAEIGPTAAAAQVTAGQTTGSLLQALKEWAESFIRQTLKKRLLDVLVDQIIQYIQGGGKPQFVTDWRGFLEDAGNAAAGDFVQSIGAGFLCSPFSLQLQLALLPVPKFSERAECTLDNIVSNIEAFHADFRNGGWIAYGAAWQPQNNFYGLLAISSTKLATEREKAAGAAFNEANAGQGFLSAKKCKTDAQGREVCQIVTPGSTLGNVVAKAVGSDIDFILSAEQLSDYVSAIANAAINRVIAEGLSAATTRNAPPRGFIPIGTTGNCAGLTGPALEACQNLVIDAANSYLTAYNITLNQIDLTLQPRIEAKAIIESSIEATEQFITNLNSLLSAFNALTVGVCPAVTFPQQPVVVSQVKLAIQNEISQATTTLANLENDLAENQSIIDPLQSARDQILALEQNDWTNLSTISLSVSGLLNPIGASNFKSGAESQQESISQNINQKLTTFNQQLQQCQATP